MLPPFTVKNWFKTALQRKKTINKGETMKKYKVYLEKNDAGEKLVILTNGSSVEQVTNMIMDVYNCPRSTIIVIKQRR